MSDQNSPQAPPEANETKAILKKIEHIESILKIDKIYTTKNNLKSKDRKEFMKHL